jgi:hypothetical protein
VKQEGATTDSANVVVDLTGPDEKEIRAKEIEVAKKRVSIEKQQIEDLARLAKEKLDIELEAYRLGL